MPLTSLPTACPTVVLRRAEEARDVRGCCACWAGTGRPGRASAGCRGRGRTANGRHTAEQNRNAFRCATCRRTRLSARADHAPGRQLDLPVRRAVPVPLGLAAPALLSRSRATGARTAPTRQGTTRNAPPRRPRPSRWRPASRASLTGPRGSAPTAVGTGRVQTPSYRLPSHVRCDARVETRRFVYSLKHRTCLVKTRRTVYCRFPCRVRPAAASPPGAVSYTHLRAHETPEHLVCRLLLDKKKSHKP